MSRWRWRLYLAIAFLGPLLCLASGVTYLYISSARLIEQRMRHAFDRVPPQVVARPLLLHQGQILSQADLVRRLNALGYSQRADVSAGGEFSIGTEDIVLRPRTSETPRETVRLTFDTSLEPGILRGRARIARLERADGPIASVTLERPVVSGLTTAGRQKQRKVTLAQTPPRVIEAVLAIEDRRFYLHPGVDAIRTVGALVTNLVGSRPYLVGGSTLTQQLVKNFFLSPEKTLQRKLLEQTMALILEQRLTKDEILELYLNEVYLGQRGSFAIHGIAEAAQLFFGKSVANLTLSEAATIAGVIQSPAVHSPFRSPDRARARRSVVLSAMARAGFITDDEALRVSREPLEVASQTLDVEAPYFVDLVGDEVERLHPDITASAQPVSILTTLDLHLQDVAQAAVTRGLAEVDRRRGDGRAEVALVALDPRSGDVLALVGGRSYRHSQFNRAVRARRQPGSVFKPFVFLTAFERAAATGRRDLTPATLVVDAPAGFRHGERTWRPSNYRNEYDGVITWRRALALSRNVATVKVAELTGYEPIAHLWNLIEAGGAPEAYPAIALGVFEATPLEIAAAYTVFASGGTALPPRTIEAVQYGTDEPDVAADRSRRIIARVDTTYLVTDMMRSVLAGGTGSRARTLGFGRDAAAKSGTTNDARDAWFVGFTPELLAVVWVGLDDNAPVGLSGTEAALPIWTEFMSAALAGIPESRFEVPPGVNLVLVDPDTGQLAGPYCPRTRQEAFLVGTGPLHRCALHVR